MECQAVASGPVSASPSPTATATSRFEDHILDGSKDEYVKSALAGDNLVALWRHARKSDDFFLTEGVCDS